MPLSPAERARAQAAWLLRWALRPLGRWQRLLFFEREVALPFPEIRASVPLEVHILAPERVGEYRAVVERAGVPWSKLEQRAALGHVCTVALSEGKLVHIRWSALGPARVPELGCSVVPGAGEAYVYDSFTPEDARGYAVQPAVACRMIEWGRARGLVRHLFYVRSHNAPGLRIVSRMGARKTRVVYCLRLRSGASWVLGIDGPGRPRLEFDADRAVRRLGPFGYWVRPRREAAAAPATGGRS